MRKKVRLVLVESTSPLTSFSQRMFTVLEATNSIEWRIGEHLPAARVDEIIKVDKETEVVIRGRK